MKYLIDAYSWIEYLEGSLIGEKLHKLLQEDNEIYVLPITIAEVVSKVKRKKGNFETAYEAVISNSKIFETTPRIAKEAALIHAEMRQKNSSFGIVDSLLIASAKFLGAKIVTGDRHFKGFPEAILI